jgi:hypothetical protein
MGRFGLMLFASAMVFAAKPGFNADTFWEMRSAASKCRRGGYYSRNGEGAGFSAAMERSGSETLAAFAALQWWH